MTEPNSYNLTNTQVPKTSQIEICAHDIPRLFHDCAHTHFYDLLPNNEIALLMIPCLRSLSEV